MSIPARIELGENGGTLDFRTKLSVPSAAQFLGVSESYLNKLRCAGGGPEFFKVGARVLYSIADLDQWLNRHRRRSTSDQGPDTALVVGIARRDIDSPRVHGDRS